MTRAQAAALGLKRYFTGNPCPHGHVAERFTAQSSCVLCHYRKCKQWTEANPVKRLAIRRKWDAVHSDKKRESIEQWQAANPEKLREIKRRYMVRRRARKRGANGTFSQKDITRIRELQNNRCAEPTCRKLLEKYHIDHIMPLAKGGSNWPRNLQLLCPRCNRFKSARDPIDYARLKGRLL